MPVLLTLTVVLAAYLIEGFRPAMLLGLVVGLGCLYYHFTQKMQSIESEVKRLRESLREAEKAAEKTQQLVESGLQSRLTDSAELDDIELDIEFDIDEENEKADLTAASASLAEISEVRAHDAMSAPSPEPVTMSSDSPSISSLESHESQASVGGRVDTWTGRHIEPTSNNNSNNRSNKPKAPAEGERWTDKLAALVKNYFTDGNLFVRIGILVLFFGVAFLLKYAAENSNLSMEFRYLGAALGGLLLLGFGWRLRSSKPTYALLLQGAGIGISYITIFAAFQLQPLLSSTEAFAMMGGLSLLTALLAVKQNSRSLAIAGILGGFLAPLLTASNSGNYIGLFSYYLALDLVVLAIAWHKAWRPLNLIGMFFTFGVFGLWFTRNYHPDLLPNTELFLILFFLLYSIIGLLYAFRQPLKLRGYVDGTLVFGTPLITFSYQAALVYEMEYGIAISAATLGVYYLALAALLWGRQGNSFRLLAESMLAIGVVFLTLAIPYALDGFWTTATWTLEAAAILWVAIKQERIYTQYFALALQLVAGMFFLEDNIQNLGDTPMLNPAFMGGFLIALGGLLSSWQLYKLKRTHPDSTAAQFHALMFVWGLLWWLGSSMMQIEHYADNQMVGCLLLMGPTAWGFMFLSIQRGWQWWPAEVTAALLVPALLLLALSSLVLNGHALIMPDTPFWLGAFALSYFVLYKLESGSLSGQVLELLYLAWLLLLVGLISVEIDWRFAQFVRNSDFMIGQGWQAIMVAIFPFITMLTVYRFEPGALARFGESLRTKVLGTLGVAVTFWFLGSSLLSAGSAQPLPFVPILNPLELVQLGYLLFAVQVLRELGRKEVLPDALTVTLSALGFIWINSVLLRGLHHGLEIPYSLDNLLQDIRVQISLSILWAVLGSLVMLLSSRLGWRTPWKVGGTLVGIVLVKMVMVDLGASGTIERIISFLVVGSLLVGMGYFSPIPDRKQESLVADPG